MSSTNMPHVNLETRLRKILFQSKNIKTVLDGAASLKMPNWYLAAGCVAQTVWNSICGFDADYGIGDYDLIYYDGDDVSEESQERHDQGAKALFKNLPHPIEAVNEARVHLWLPEHIGHFTKPYESSEDAIGSWAFPSSCVGVRYENGTFSVYAPYGLEAMFDMTLQRTGKSIFTKEMDEKKIAKWTKLWPRLKVEIN
jgi:uncharacterized protein